MTRIALLLVLAFSLSACASRQPKSASNKRMNVRTTAYTHTEAGGRNNAIGTRLRYGSGEYSAASDWSWIPLGTRFKIVGSKRIYVIEDYGSALVGRQTIDLYMPTRRDMRDWGCRMVDIEIIEWGSKAMSLKLLEPRRRNSHVAVMVSQLRRQGITLAVPQG